MSTSSSEIASLARELFEARALRKPVTPPSAREGGCSLDSAYAIEGELMRVRRATGHATVGRKVGYANKAMWRVLKLPTLVWANMYDDTVHYAENGTATLSLAAMYSPRIEPEVIFKLKRVPAAKDADAVLDAVEWMSLGFEIVDSPYPDWKFEPVDFVASFGLHAALIVGEQRPVLPANIPALVEQLASFKLKLSKDGALAEEGAGRNALRSPALCLGELASAISNQAGVEPLQPGELVSTGTLTNAQPIAAGERWTAEAGGIDLAPITLVLT
jgi:2-oxo-3-hexenedioate decarboxylase